MSDQKSLRWNVVGSGVSRPRLFRGVLSKLFPKRVNRLVVVIGPSGSGKTALIDALRLDREQHDEADLTAPGLQRSPGASIQLTHGNIANYKSADPSTYLHADTFHEKFMSGSYRHHINLLFLASKEVEFVLLDPPVDALFETLQFRLDLLDHRVMRLGEKRSKALKRHQSDIVEEVDHQIEERRIRRIGLLNKRDVHLEDRDLKGRLVNDFFAMVKSVSRARFHIFTYDQKLPFETYLGSMVGPSQLLVPAPSILEHANISGLHWDRGGEGWTGSGNT